MNPRPELGIVSPAPLMPALRWRLVKSDEVNLLESIRHPDPQVVLPAIRSLLSSIDEFEFEAVKSARALGMSWETIAQLLGRVRSSVWERYAKGKGVP